MTSDLCRRSLTDLNASHPEPHQMKVSVHDTRHLELARFFEPQMFGLQVYGRLEEDVGDKLSARVGQIVSVCVREGERRYGYWRFVCTVRLVLEHFCLFQALVQGGPMCMAELYQSFCVTGSLLYATNTRNFRVHVDQERTPPIPKIRSGE